MKHEETSQSKMWRRKEGGKEELGVRQRERQKH